MTRPKHLSAIVALMAALSGLAVAHLCAQAATPQTAVPAVDTLYADATAKEAAVRKALVTDEPQPSLLKAVRTVIADYETVVRHYPATGYADDALWRAGRLSRDAFEAFQDPRERATALRLFQLLASQYPSSRLAKAAPEQVTWLNAHPARTAAAPGSLGRATAPVATPTSPTQPSAAPPIAKVTLKAVRRAVLPDIVRVVLELDEEVAFRDERLDNPSRVVLDLPTTRPLATLTDKTIRFDADTDIVRQVRVGLQPNSGTRIVVETAGVSSYSVYPLYSPYRLVIDCVRAVPKRAEATLPRQSAGAAATSPVPAPRTTAPALPPLTSDTVLGVLPLVAATSPALQALAPAVADPVPAAALTPSIVPADSQKRLPLPEIHNGDGGLSMARQLGLGVSRIVIDPGHGGHDPGAQGPNGNEADLTLDVALRLEKLLMKVRGVEVVLTRRDNSFVALQERTAIANREGADLFLSIHANASSTPAARGVETYFLNFASNQGAAAVAARENATSGQAMGTLQDVVKAIALNSKLDESRDFATQVHRELLDSLKGANKSVKDLGVKQAPFFVLVGAAMPSVLAEISFITNPQEAKLLESSGYRQRIAQALLDGIKQYQSSLRRAPVVAQQQD